MLSRSNRSRNSCVVFQKDSGGNGRILATISFLFLSVCKVVVLSVVRMALTLAVEIGCISAIVARTSSS